MRTEAAGYNWVRISSEEGAIAPPGRLAEIDNNIAEGGMRSTAIVGRS